MRILYKYIVVFKTCGFDFVLLFNLNEFFLKDCVEGFGNFFVVFNDYFVFNLWEKFMYFCFGVDMFIVFY